MIYSNGYDVDANSPEEAKAEIEKAMAGEPSKARPFYPRLSEIDAATDRALYRIEANLGNTNTSVEYIEVIKTDNL